MDEYTLPAEDGVDADQDVEGGNLPTPGTQGGGGGLSALRALAYGDAPQPGAKMLEQDPIDPSTKWLAYAAGALTPGHFSQSMQGALGALAGQQSKEQELKAKYLPIVANAMIQRQMMQFQMAQQQIKLTQQYNDVMTGQLTGLLALPREITKQDAVTAVGEAVQRSQVPLQLARQFVQALPDDPAQLRSYITRASIGVLPATDRMKRVAPEVEMKDTGAGFIPANVNPMAGTTPVGAMPGGIEKQLTPGERVPKTLETPTGPAAYAPTTGKAAPVGTPEAQALTAEAMAGQPLPSGPAPSTPLVKDPARLEYNNVTAKNAAEYEEGLNAKVDAMRDLNGRMAEMRKALADFRPGAAAETRQKLGSWGKDLLASVGARPEVAAKFGDALAGGNIGSMQDFQKVAVQGAMEALKSALPAGSRSTQMEFATFQRNNPAITMDPEGLDKVLNFMAGQYQKASAEQAALAEYKKTGQPMDGFRAYWNQKSQELGLQGAVEATGTAPNSVQPRAAAQLGVANSGRRIKYNPKISEWEYQ